MTHLLMTHEQRSARPDVASAVAFAAPLWASALLVLIAVFTLMGTHELLSFGFFTMAIAIVVLASIATFHTMVRDLRRDSALRGVNYRRMIFYRDVIDGLYSHIGRNATFKARAYAAAGMRERARMRSMRPVSAMDESLHKRRISGRHR